MSEVYFEKKTCSNCKRESNLAIPKGTTIKDYMKDRKCKNCGCLLGAKGKCNAENKPEVKG